MLCLVLPIFISAVKPPSVETGFGTEVGLTIEYPPIGSLKINRDMDFYFHVFNTTNELPIVSGINCSYQLHNQTGSMVYLEEISETDVITGDFYINIKGSNFSVFGEYYHLFHCNNSFSGGFVLVDFEVTQDGGDLTTGDSILYSSLLFFLTICLILAIVGIIINKGLLIKFSFICITYLLLMIVTFVFWNVGQNFITNDTAIVIVLWVIWRVLSWMFLPFVIIGFCWCFYTMITAKEIQALVDQGIEPDEAKQRIKERKKKW